MLSEGNRYERIETTFSKRVLSSTLLSYDKKRRFFLILCSHQTTNYGQTKKFNGEIDTHQRLQISHTLREIIKYHLTARL